VKHIKKETTSMSSHKFAITKAASNQNAAECLNTKIAVVDESDVNESEEARVLAADIERAVSEGRCDILTTEALQELMAATCKLYAAKVGSGEQVLPCGPHHGVSATDVMMTANGFLRAANLAALRLGIWQSWTGR
jgi:hypothetical protein